MKLTSILAGAALAASTFAASADGIVMLTEHHHYTNGLVGSKFWMNKRTDCESLYRDGFRAAASKGVSPLNVSGDGTHTFKAYEDYGYVLVKCQPLGSVTLMGD